MKKRLSSLFLAGLLLTSSGCQQGRKEVVNEYNIVPMPNQMTPQEGRFQLSDKVLVVTANCTPEVQAIADSLIARVQLTAGISLQSSSQEHAESPAIRFTTVEGMPKEGYNLSVSPNEIILTASQPNGFFYGVQTMYQLLPPAIYGKEKVKRADWSLPAVQIEDAPRFSYRGLMMDPCRHFVDTDYIYKFIDMLAMHKMNTFHWHLTDDQGWRIEIKKYPKLQEIGSKRKETLIDYYYVNWPQIFDGKEHGGYYTQDQIKDIVAYAASKYITVIPEIEMPGHALGALAAYPELSCRPDRTYEVATTWGIFEEVYCPKEETFQFLEGVLDEVLELFPSSYIHIGGDECPKTAWKNCAHCQALIKKLGLKDDTTPNSVDGKKHTKEEKLQSYFVTRMEKYLNSKGRSIIGWDEILEGGLAPNATVMSWRGVEGGITAAKAGHDAIMTPSPYAYLDQYQEEPEVAPTTIGGYNTLKKTYSYNPVPDDAEELIKKHIIGVQGNMWAEYIQSNDHRDYQTYPRAIALAETGWTQNAVKNWDCFRRRMVEDFKRMDILEVKASRNFFDVNINTRVYDGSLKAVLETFYPDAEIRYTKDGSAPTAKSELYAEPFTWEGSIDLQAAAFKDGKMLGKVNSKKMYANLISGKKYTTVPKCGWMSGDIFSENDVLGADPTTLGLTNGKRGNIASFTPWVTFKLNNNNNNELVFSVDMETTATVSKVTFGTLYNPAFRVLPAGGVCIEASLDGKDFKEIGQGTFTREYPERGRKMFTDTVECTPTEARYIKVTLKSGGVLRNGIDCRKDSPDDIIPSDLFVDEIEVY
ncbi:glycoside hydrolase family 20 protein [Bacteroides sp. UBA939]|uniref:glycoside hydrolase family 20 protein n=1 Tax=Bacteroides sp. UBA939 TaxID=1946092 RepID=UPI0025BBA905|nr:glycoside hydrolase family 20 protein [Bacteroides sp. UBA939]